MPDSDPNAAVVSEADVVVSPDPAVPPPPSDVHPDTPAADPDREYVAAVLRKQAGVPSAEARAAAETIYDEAVQQLCEAGRAGDVAKVRALLGVE